MDTSRDDENNQEGSIASGNNDDVGIEAFQTVFQDIHTAVERHSLNSNAILAMVKSGSKGSLHKLVQQSVCLGLQLLDGKRWLSGKEPMEGFWEYPGIIESSFLDGLKYEEFMNHVISKRSLPKGYGVEGAGELFRSCMFGMRELYAAYDGSVRTRCGNHIVQFCYDNDSEGGEAVGALAVTAVIEPAYNYTFEQSVSTTVNPITLLKVRES
jgi:DNA-directed RNA polymerase-4 subunit 1